MSVDLGGIEKTRQIFQRMLFAALHARGIENPVPVFVRPASRTDADVVQVGEDSISGTADGGLCKRSIGASYACGGGLNSSTTKGTKVHEGKLRKVEIVDYHLA